jgi:hypothetical protein
MEAGTPAATVARQMNVSRDTVYKWWRRAQADRDGQWWADRSSRPLRSPARTRRKLERKILSLRRNKEAGSRPHRRAPAGSPVDGARRAGAQQRLPPGLDGPPHRSGDSPLRAQASGRPGPRRRQEAGQGAVGRRWKAHGRFTATRSAKAKRTKVGDCFVHSAVALVAAGVRLRAMFTDRPSLEDLFVSLTGEGFGLGE